MKKIFFLSCFFYSFIILPFCQSQTFRFAWLSDTHVGSTTGADDLSKAVREIYSMKDISFIIISGDITESGKSMDLKSAKSILDSLRRPYYVIPGNHDTKWSESGCTYFSQLWGDDKFKFEYNGFLFIGLHQGPIMKMGDGHFSPEDLQWLDSQLTQIKKDQPIIFVTHYPIDPSVDNWYELIRRAKQYNTKTILVGHGHANQSLNFEVIPGVMGRSTLRSRKTFGGYTIAKIQKDSFFFYEKITGIDSLKLWYSLSLENRNYFSDTGNYERPDFSINKKYPNIQIKWTFDSKNTIASTPAVGKDIVIVGNSSGKVYGISIKDGSEKWNFKAEKAVYSSPEIKNNRVVFGSADGSIYCLNVKNGELLWKYKTDASIVASPKIEHDIVFIGTSGGRFEAIDLEEGFLKWEYIGVEGFIETKACVYEDKVLFGAWDTFLYALSIKDGSIIWRWSNNKPHILYSPAACLPVASNGKIFIVAPDRCITAIAIKTGKNIWRTNAHSVRESIGISEDGFRIYAKCMNDTLLAFDSKSDIPKLLWSKNCGYGYDIDPCMPVEKNGVVFFGTKNGFVYALNAKNGEVEWRYRVGVTIINTINPIDNNNIVISDLDGRVMMIQRQ